MSLIILCLVHYGMVRWSGDEPSMLFDPFGVAVKRIYQPLTTILLCHGEVAYIDVLISRQSLNSTSFPSMRYPRELVVTFKS
jgi:hypothetical protein